MAKKIIWALSVLFFMAIMTLGFWHLNSSVKTEAKSQDEIEKYKQVEKDIQSLNLINGLYLSREQMSQLLPIVEESARLQKEGKDKLYKYIKDSGETCILMRKQLLDNNDITQDLKDRHNKTLSWGEEEKARYDYKMEELTQKAKGVLNENQLIITKEYVPCLIPHQSSANPERIGQAGGNPHIESLLEKARELPQETYERLKPRFLEKVRRKVERHIKDKEQQDAFMKKVEETLEQVRKMSQEEFATAKSQIIEDLKPALNTQGEDRLDENIKNYLLNPGMTEILKYKIKKI